MAAAQTASAFKPRAGGAAEKLREAQAALKAQGPDGINAVVPAPSLLRGLSSDSTGPPATILPFVPSTSKSPIPRTSPSPQKADEGVPEVKVTMAPSERPSSIETPSSVPKDMTAAETPKNALAKRTKLPPRITMSKEIASLGIDPAILGDRGGELVEAWDQFNFKGKGIRNINVDKMIEDVNRELNKLQTGGWLKLMEDEDARIAAIQDGLDKCIEECDELDGLLTLYNVELGVSHILIKKDIC